MAGWCSHHKGRSCLDPHGVAKRLPRSAICVICEICGQLFSLRAPPCLRGSKKPPKTAKKLDFSANYGIMRCQWRPDRTHAKGVHPVVNPHLLVGDCTKNRGSNKPCPCKHRITFQARNLKIHIPSIHRGVLYETNPISLAVDLWKSQKCEANPIYPHSHPARTRNIRNEPNLTRGGPVEAPKMRSEPNLPPQPPGPHPKNAKRTQFTTRPRSQRAGIPRLCETNPISTRPTANRHQPKIRNEP